MTPSQKARVDDLLQKDRDHRFALVHCLEDCLLNARSGNYMDVQGHLSGASEFLNKLRAIRFEIRQLEREVGTP